MLRPKLYTYSHRGKDQVLHLVPHNVRVTLKHTTNGKFAAMSHRASDGALLAQMGNHKNTLLARIAVLNYLHRVNIWAYSVRTKMSVVEVHSDHIPVYARPLYYPLVGSARS